MDDLGLVETVDGLGQSIVVAVADATHRGLDTSFDQALGVFDRDVLAASVAVMHEPAAMEGPPIMQSLLQGVEHEVGVRRSGRAPANEAPRVRIDDEGDIDEARPGRHVGEVGEPKRIRALRLELPIDVIQRAWRRLVADRGSDRLAADHALQTKGSHQPCHGAAGNVVTFALQLPPDLAHAVDTEVLLEPPPNLLNQGVIPPRPRRQSGRIGAPGDMRMVGRWGDRQHPADRLDPVRPAVIVDEGDHGLCRRSSSAWAKYALALRRISLAWRSSRFSRSRALSLAAMSPVRPGLCPLSRAAFFTHSFRVWGGQTIFPAIG